MLCERLVNTKTFVFLIESSLNKYVTQIMIMLNFYNAIFIILFQIRLFYKVFKKFISVSNLCIWVFHIHIHLLNRLPYKNYVTHIMNALLNLF